MDYSSARYTQLFQRQEARVDPLFDRPFYTAGEKIDGSIIQHCPGTEIMQVDFSKDKALRDFYVQAIGSYESEGFLKKKITSLPQYIQQRVERKVFWSAKIVDALQDETVDIDNVLLNSDELKKNGIDVDKLIKVAKWGPHKNTKIGIGTYLQIGAGVCRQQGVIVAACMERAIKEGRAPGWKGAEIRANLDTPGGHLWAVCLDDKGKEHIFDPAQHYQGRPDGGNWNYELGYEKHVFGIPDTKT